jgi:DNA-binding CsgD family transcriptional regulator
MISLTAPEQAKVADATRLFVSPLEMASLDTWAGAVMRTMKDVLQAERAILMMPLQPTRRYFADDVNVRDVTSYPERVAPLASRISAWERVNRLGAYTRDDLWRPILRDYFRSEYYNEFIVPIRLFNPIGVGVAVNGPPSAASVSQLQFYSGREGGTRFGRRGVGILRILYPAFHAAVRVCMRLASERTMLASALDAMRDGILLYSHAGAVLHENTALQTTLQRDPERSRLVAEISAVARAVTSVTDRRKHSTIAVTTPTLTREIHTHRARYRATGTALGDWLGGGAAVLVCLEQVTPEPPSAESIQDRLGLTRRGADVALLVAEGLGNDDIAKRLSISSHTVRHHLEQVMSRLGVSSRAAVTRKLFT